MRVKKTCGGPDDVPSVRTTRWTVSDIARKRSLNVDWKGQGAILRGLKGVRCDKADQTPCGRAGGIWTVRFRRRGRAGSRYRFPAIGVTWFISGLGLSVGSGF